MLHLFKKRAVKSAQPQNTNEFYSLISFAVAEEKQNNIVLGKRKDEIFVCFRNPDLAAFFTDWFSMLKLHRESQLSEEAYNKFIESILEQTETLQS